MPAGEQIVIYRGRIRFEFEMVFEWPIFGLFSNRILESTRIFYTYCNRVHIRRQEARRKVRDSTYALRTSKNIRFEFKTIFECRKIRKTLKFSNFKSNNFSIPTPSNLIKRSLERRAKIRAVLCLNIEDDGRRMASHNFSQ